ncbi:DUF1254 domain-containing protein [Vibrio rumoiensis]|uniref:DUF1254 domain-containing protein n=1 Tax=Vibrio rumoiensis 1S-45 TaxID=1188252 RepID=A0A1E5E4Q8_9VIBR|nr:DUF1254 domain-containing protein [Vibrio rumoiensis]OEF27469.1 hypothetical protein A1QC_15115 [Vibrio rumoiensis 1S-45]
MKKFMLSALLVACAPSAFAEKIPDNVAKDAFLYAYSMDKAYDFFYETTLKSNYPLNRFQNIRKLADDTYTAHPTINNDTLHLMGWLDVAAEPVIVSVPDMDKGRYWILQTMDMGHYTDAMIGSRNRGEKGGQFMFASKSWKGDVPDSVDEVIRVDSDIIKVMGRIMAVDKSNDEQIARNYMDLWNIRTLSAYLGIAPPPPVKRDYPNAEKVTWLTKANFLLCQGSMVQADANWLSKYKSTGLEACKTDFTKEQLRAAKVGEELGLKEIKALAPTLTDSRVALGTRADLQNADRTPFDVGTYLGQWGLPAVEAMYRQGQKGSDGEVLSGANGKEYTMKFKAPDVSEFWSITVYANDNRLMAHNELNRHSRGDRTLTPDKDGYYHITLTSDVKGKEDDPNILPIPKKPFYLMMRLYGASEAIQAGKAYPMPAATPVK